MSDIVPDQLKSARVKLLFKKNIFVFLVNYRLVTTQIRFFLLNILEKLAVHKHLIKPTCCVNFNLALETRIPPIFALLTFLTTHHMCNSQAKIDLQKKKRMKHSNLSNLLQQASCDGSGDSNRILPSNFIKKVQNLISQSNVEDKSCGI